MRKFVLLFICGLSSMSFAQSYPKTQAEAARTFVRIFQKADTAALLSLLPPVSVYRMTSPDETQGKSDSEIIVMAEPLRSDMVYSFRTLLREADSLKIDRSKIKVTDQKISPVLTYPGFYGIRIFFSYGKKQSEFSLGAAFIDNSWYIYGIDQYQGVFVNLVSQK